MTEQEIIAAIIARRTHYQAKLAKADPLADDDCNRHGMLTHTVEAFDWLLSEIGAAPPAKVEG